MTTLETLAAGRYVVHDSPLAPDWAPDAQPGGPRRACMPRDAGLLGRLPEGRLFFRTARRTIAARRLRRTEGVETVLTTTEFVTFAFPAEQFETVATIMRPRLLPSRPVRRSFAEVQS